VNVVDSLGIVQLTFKTFRFDWIGQLGPVLSSWSPTSDMKLRGWRTSLASSFRVGLMAVLHLFHCETCHKLNKLKYISRVGDDANINRFGTARQNELCAGPRLPFGDIYLLSPFCMHTYSTYIHSFMRTSMYLLINKLDEKTLSK
jgi:hypothetical protein